MECLSQESVGFEDVMAQMQDMLNPAVRAGEARRYGVGGRCGQQYRVWRCSAVQCSAQGSMVWASRVGG